MKTIKLKMHKQNSLKSNDEGLELAKAPKL